ARPPRQADLRAVAHRRQDHRVTVSSADRAASCTAPKADAKIDRMHRVVLVVLASSAALVGAWAQVAPGSFYADFPGLRRFWVSLDGPFNEHLIRDVGGLNLALAALTAAAAISGRARLARLAAACWLIFSVPHFAYHATHLGPFGAIDAT